MSQYQVLVQDETGQKRETLTVSATTTWAEVVDKAVGLLDLPRFQEGNEPAIFHGYASDTGQTILPLQSVGEALGELDSLFRVTVSPEMKPATASQRMEG